MVVAPVAAGREAGLRDAARHHEPAPGHGRSRRTRCSRSARFERLHFARFVHARRRDAGRPRRAIGVPRRRVPIYLVFLGDCDGPARRAAGRARASAPATGCARSSRTARASTRAATCSTGCWRTTGRRPRSYVNWVGRTVRQIREESALQRALVGTRAARAARRGAEPQALRRDLLRLRARPSISAGRLTLTPPAPTPLGWRLAQPRCI